MRKDVSKAINKALKNEVKETLLTSGVPPWAVGRVHDFTAGLYPFVKSSDAKHGTASSPPYIIDPPQETAEELATQFQTFYAELEEGLLTGGNQATARPTRDNVLESEQDKVRERRSNGKVLSEQHVHEILEAVERVICALFYDRSTRRVSIVTPRLTLYQVVFAAQVRRCVTRRSTFESRGRAQYA